jgi:hypothetical protein
MQRSDNRFFAALMTVHWYLRVKSLKDSLEAHSRPAKPSFSFPLDDKKSVRPEADRFLFIMWGDIV